MTNQENTKKTLTTTEYDLLEKILKSTQAGLIKSLSTFFRGVYGEKDVIATADYIVAKGDIPVGIVAHADTVHATPVQDLYFDRIKNTMWSPEGLGADDRAGVFAMIKILQSGLRPTLIVTTDEEVGGIGASKLVGDIRNMDLNFLIELDRRGGQDAVFYDCDNLDFEDYIEDFGFKTSWGSFSDICILCPVWGMAGVNLSIGYYNEHTSREILVVDEMLDTIEKTENILRSVSDADTFEFIEAVSSYSKYFKSGGSYDSYSYYGYSSAYGCSDGDYFEDGYTGEDANKGLDYCYACMGTFKEKDLLITSESLQYCERCYDSLYTMCPECGDDFYNRDGTAKECDNCSEKGAY